MKKICIDGKKFSKQIQLAIAENIPDIIFLTATEADASTPKFSITSVDKEKIRVGKIIDEIVEHFQGNFTIAALPNISFDLRAQKAKYLQKQISLTEKEAELLRFLLGDLSKNPAARITKNDILQQVWKYASDTDTRTVESHIHRLNAKFEENFGFKIINLAEGEVSFLTPISSL